VPPPRHGRRLVRSQLRVPRHAPGTARPGRRRLRTAARRGPRRCLVGHRAGRDLHRTGHLLPTDPDMTRKRYWLMKSEPTDFSIDDLERVRTEPWTGVRNYQARNFMRQMQVGDGVLFYHSNTDVPGIYGIAEVACTAYP